MPIANAVTASQHESCLFTSYRSLNPQLVKEINRLGKLKEDGSVVVTFRELFEGTDGVFEALLGTLRTAKRHKVCSFTRHSTPLQTFVAPLSWVMKQSC